jgi:hypothetical protein
LDVKLGDVEIFLKIKAGLQEPYMLVPSKDIFFCDGKAGDQFHKKKAGGKH